MDKDTKKEVLKIFLMIIALILLILGIVWLNKSNIEEKVENKIESLEEDSTKSVDNINSQEEGIKN